jgi:hypothetical protein
MGSIPPRNTPAALNPEFGSRMQVLQRAQSNLLVLLAPPRSFTTILSAMLGQHPQMYGLPEVHLFVARTMEEWWNLCSKATFNMDHGLLRVVAQLIFGDQTEYTVKQAMGWLRRRAHCSTAEIVETLAQQVDPRILVDKSPSVVYRPEFLRHIFEMFPQARFIHLLRHPRGHGESVMKYLRARHQMGAVPATHWLLQLAGYPSLSVVEDDVIEPSSDLDPQRAWYVLNMNICNFLSSVPAHQQIQIRGEDALANPDQELVRIACWLGLRVDEEAVREMKHPERSPYARYGPPGAHFGNDRNFLHDPVLHSEVARPNSLKGPLSWRQDGSGFLPQVTELAEQFGYD